MKYFLLAIALSTFGCAHERLVQVQRSQSVAQTAPDPDPYIGKHEDELIFKFGDPKKKRLLHDGSVVWIYFEDKGARQVVRNYGEGQGFGFRFFRKVSGNSTSVASQERITCKRSFVIDSHIIQRWDEEGNGC